MCQDLICPACSSECSLCCGYNPSTGRCEHMPQEEPPDGSFIRTGDRHPYKFWQRDDGATIESGYGPTHNWWDCTYDDGGPDGPLTWEEVLIQPEPMHVSFTPLDD